MIRFVSRFIGLSMLLAAGFVFLIYDGTKSIAGSGIFITKLRRLGTQIDSDQPAAAAARHRAACRPVVVGPGDILSVLTTPTWLVLRGLGALLILAGRRKKPLIGYARS